MTQILLIDDDEAVLNVTAKMLEAINCQAYLAHSGQEALDFCKNSKIEIDLVILDETMRGLSGGETFDLLRKINPELKVILASGYGLDEKIQATLSRGCNGFLHKPFQLKDLEEKIKEVL